MSVVAILAYPVSAIGIPLVAAEVNGWHHTTDQEREQSVLLSPQQIQALCAGQATLRAADNEFKPTPCPDQR